MIGNDAGPGLHPGVEPVDEHHSAGRRGRRAEQQRVIAACANTGYRAGRKAAKAIRLEPFRAIVDHHGYTSAERR